MTRRIRMRLGASDTVVAQADCRPAAVIVWGVLPKQGKWGL
ncbi:MAG TPA: hypothetical protein VNZ94_12030 [Xanthobacteraceae bacterium]|nr:hypothetical protein [Xanthobacteraceae bacterium]